MIKAMITERISEGELARDVSAVLEKVRQGVEVVVEQDHKAVAVIKPHAGPGRKLSECAALARAYEARLGEAPIPDKDFAADVRAGIEERSEPFDPTPWE